MAVEAVLSEAPVTRTHLMSGKQQQQRIVVLWMAAPYEKVQKSTHITVGLRILVFSLMQ